MDAKVTGGTWWMGSDQLPYGTHTYFKYPEGRREKVSRHARRMRLADAFTAVQRNSHNFFSLLKRSASLAYCVGSTFGKEASLDSTAFVAQASLAGFDQQVILIQPCNTCATNGRLPVGVTTARRPAREPRHGHNASRRDMLGYGQQPASFICRQ